MSASAPPAIRRTGATSYAGNSTGLRASSRRTQYSIYPRRSGRQALRRTCRDLLETAIHNADDIDYATARGGGLYTSRRAPARERDRGPPALRRPYGALTEPNFSTALDAYLATRGPAARPTDHLHVAVRAAGDLTVRAHHRPRLARRDRARLSKTTVPRSLLWCETSSPLFGLTTDPRNRAFTPGGLSGGSDIGGASGSRARSWGSPGLSRAVRACRTRAPPSARGGRSTFPHRRAHGADDDPLTMKGHSVGLQVIERKFKEEKTLAGMKIIEGIIRETQA
ncbi:hypothetical protein BZA05DRAFT_441096 [Tricharina praecox]|uniref:uncharacterized protein n=1 Tax=Tricharina praecox TaxID=43433 RepID=UPI00221F9A7B|nr:uncharacterized protein BZA05DRAFT_441096 [Tricharina praecox]KAI5857794.1 hypothetical protein BZA05DRAFT_441096 [Tricharina praecox]